MLAMEPKEGKAVEDEMLVERIKNGDDDAFRELYHKYVHQVFRYVYLQIGDYQRTEELTQDIFMKVVKGLMRFRGQSRFQTWLFTIVRNCLTDELRTYKKKRLTVTVPQEDLARLDERVDTVEDQVMKREAREELIRHLQKLSDDYRVVILLVDLEGFSLREAAEILNRSEKATKSLHHRAVRQLRQLVEGGVNVEYS